MMASQPAFTPFEPLAETWDVFMERFECYLQAGDLLELSGSRKRGYFLSVCGRDVFITAKALVSPVLLRDAPWDVLTAKLKEHYAPAPSILTCRHAFRQRMQREGESIAAYVAALRTAAGPCEFRDLDEPLLEQLVCGVRDLKLQRRLLARKGMTLALAIEEAQAAEMSDRSASEIQSFHPQGSTSQSAIKGSVHYEGSEPDGSSEEEGSVRRVKSAPRRKVQANQGQQKMTCAGCGGAHARADCRFKSVICRSCGKRGHLAKVCRSTRPPQESWQEPSRASKKKSFSTNQEDCFEVCRSSLAGQAGDKLYVTVTLAGAKCTMEVDTGSSKTIISWGVLKRLLPHLSPRHLHPCPFRLKDYLGTSIPIMGSATFDVSFKGYRGRLPLIVVEGELPTLLGMDWFRAFELHIPGVNSICCTGLEGLLTEFADVFDGELGSFKGAPISFNLDPQIAPIRLKPRRVPFALRHKVDQELDKLISQGILEQVDHAPWETPIVIPIKSDGSIRICADYKGTINRALQANPYPVPVVQHLLHSLGQGSIFAKLDLAQAYQQLPVDEATALAQTIVTHRGAFKCKRLQFGVCIAPGIFQSLMERLLQGLEGVVPYFDDVLIAAKDYPDLLTTLRAVLTRLRSAGLKLKRNKCQFGVPEVDFLGFRLDKKGIHPSPTKIEAIKRAPTPRNKGDLQAFLGLMNFYAMFLPHKASLAEPLHRLLDAKSVWHWGKEAAASFAAIKDLLASSAVLVQFDPKQPLSLTCDASPYGIGAVLSHVLPNGAEAPVAYYSRTLSASERNYSQLDKEALAAVAGIKRFHEYLYGRFFYLITDHKPLLGILAGNRQSPPILSPRMTRWIEFLSAYNYELQHRSGKSIGHADALSRCPLPIPVTDPAPVHSVLLIEEWHGPISAADVAEHTAKDPTLSRVLDWIRRGWPAANTLPEFTPFSHRQLELSTMKGCLLWGSRVVIPPSLRKGVLESLHEAHPGVVRMKALGRSLVWWPKMDQEIEQWVARCHTCQQSRPLPTIAPVRDWEMPRSPWSRIHLDFAGPFQGETFLIAVDAYSRWVELARMTSTTAESTIQTLERWFATHGLPDLVVTDNGPQFVSALFQGFLAQLGIRHALTAPYHPAANGRAERAVRSAKEALARLGPNNWHSKIYRYLLAQHTTPCQVLKASPAELLMGRRLRTTLDRLHPSYCGASAPGDTMGTRSFLCGDSVWVLNPGGRQKWIPGVITGITGPCSYRVRLEDGREWRRHVNQLRRQVPSPQRGGGTPDHQQAAPDHNIRRPDDLASHKDTITNPLSPTETLQGAHNKNNDTLDNQARPYQPGGPQITKTGTFSAKDLPGLSEGSPSDPSDSTSPAKPAINPLLATAGPTLRRSKRSRRPPPYLADYACAIREGRGVEYE